MNKMSKLKTTGTTFDPETKTWHGPKMELLSGPDVSLGRSIVESLIKSPEHISQICYNNGKKYTNKEIYDMSVRVCQHLEEMGIQQEDVIGICAFNTDFLAPLVFGSLFCGAILSSLDPSFDKDGIKHTFGLTKPKLMFCDGSVYQTMKESLSEIGLQIPIFTMSDHLDGVRRIDELLVSTGKEDSFTVKPLKLGSKQTAAILCSSGTTGLPKGVCMSHEGLLERQLFNFSEEDILLCFSTIYWISGFASLVYGTICGCIRIITNQKFTAELFLRMVEEYKVTIAFTPPSQLALAISCPEFNNSDLSSLEFYLCGGSAVPFACVQEFIRRLPQCLMVTGYGMTEVCGGICFGTPTRASENGKLMRNLSMKIIDDDGHNLGIGEQGEICLRKPIPWAGYYGNPEATKQIYDEAGYIHTGDIGYVDENGSLFIVDRKKDILKYNNFHYSPTEIEEVIAQIPDVVEVCVCGIPDIVSSFLPAAAVIKVPGSSLTEEDVSKYVAERMAHFKHLHGGVYFLESLPKTVSGKNVRAKVTAIVEQLRNQKKE